MSRLTPTPGPLPIAIGRGSAFPATNAYAGNPDCISRMRSLRESANVDAAYPIVMARADTVLRGRFREGWQANV